MAPPLAHVFQTLPVVNAVTSLLPAAYVKGSCRSQVPPCAAHLCLCSDGTEVTEEFFQMLPDNTELVLLSREQHWSGGGDPTVLLNKVSQIRDTNVTGVSALSFRGHQQVAVHRHSGRRHHRSSERALVRCADLKEAQNSERSAAESGGQV